MSYPRPVKNTICAVFITFNADSQFPKRVETIKPQVDRILIFDNGSDASFQQILEPLQQDEKIDIIYSEKNIGIAAALNRTVIAAQEKGYPWILTLDHDSTAAGNLISRYARIFDLQKNKEEVAMIGCNYVDTNNQRYYVDPLKHKTREWLENTIVISSGCLLSVAAYQTIGEFREDFFIDGVDTEYCLRTWTRHFKIIFVLEALLQHSVGKQELVSFCRIPSLKISKTNYAVFRRYYCVRNNLILIRDYFLVCPGWTILRFMTLAGSCLKALLLEEDKAKKFRMMRLGFWDFLTKNMSRKVIPENINEHS